MNRNSIQEAIDTVNGFESKLVQPNITNYKTYQSVILLVDIPQNADLIEFLQQRLEKSKQFTSNLIKSKLFTLTETHLVLNVEYKPTFTMHILENASFIIPDQWNMDELIGVVEKN